MNFSSFVIGIAFIVIAAALATRPLCESSFGCFLLSVPDAKWIHDHVPYGTTVIAERAPLLLQNNNLAWALVSARAPNQRESSRMPKGGTDTRLD